MKLTRGKSITIALSWLTWIEAVSSIKLEKSWTYELKSVEATSSNPDLLEFRDWRVERVARGIYATSGTVIFNYDIVEGDHNELEVTSYRSKNGIDEYRPLPFKVSRLHDYKGLNTFYKDMAMDTLKGCSDMPVFEGKFEPPFEKKTYTINKCQFSQDGFPQYMQDGFYKAILAGYGDVDWIMTFIVEISNNS